MTSPTCEALAILKQIEAAAHFHRSAALNSEKSSENNDIGTMCGFEHTDGDVEPLKRAQNGDHGRDNAITVNQSCLEQTPYDQHTATTRLVRSCQ